MCVSAGFSTMAVATAHLFGSLEVRGRTCNRLETQVMDVGKEHIRGQTRLSKGLVLCLGKSQLTD